jgi:hypothetical protein
MKCSINGDWSCDGDCEFHLNDDYEKCLIPAWLDSLGGMNFIHKGKELHELICAGIPDESPIRLAFKGEIIKKVSKNVTVNGKPMITLRSNSPFKIAFTLDKAKKNLESLGYPNFTYDRLTGLVFADFAGGAHDLFMSSLYVLNKIKNGTANERQKNGSIISNREMFGVSTYCESFITEGYGFFSSSVNMGFGVPRHRGFPIIFSENHKLTSQEKAIFKPYGFRPLKEKE